MMAVLEADSDGRSLTSSGVLVIFRRPTVAPGKRRFMLVPELTFAFRVRQRLLTQT